MLALQRRKLVEAPVWQETAQASHSGNRPPDRSTVNVPEIVVSLFDLTTHMVAPWAEAGYLCYCVDLAHPKGEHREGNIIRVGADVREWLPPFSALRMLFAFPPCTHVAVSGARWFEDKGLGALIESLQLFDASVRLAEWSKAPYLIENPVSTVSTYWRKPDYTFDPCDYGRYLTPLADAYTKRTCLWTGNGFVMPRTKRIVPFEGSRMHRLPPSERRASLRSATPRGFAQAVFEANAGGSSADYGSPGWEPNQLRQM